MPRTVCRVGCLVLLSLRLTILTLINPTRIDHSMSQGSRTNIWNSEPLSFREISYNTGQHSGQELVMTYGLWFSLRKCDNCCIILFYKKIGELKEPFFRNHGSSCEIASNTKIVWAKAHLTVTTLTLFSGNSTPTHPLVMLITLKRTYSYVFFWKI